MTETPNKTPWTITDEALRVINDTARDVGIDDPIVHISITEDHTRLTLQFLSGVVLVQIYPETVVETVVEITSETASLGVNDFVELLRKEIEILEIRQSREKIQELQEERDGLLMQIIELTRERDEARAQIPSEFYEPDGLISEVEDNAAGVRATLYDGESSLWEVLAWRGTDRVSIEALHSDDPNAEYVTTRGVAVWLAAHLLRAARVCEGEAMVAGLQGPSDYEHGVLITDVVASALAAAMPRASIEGVRESMGNSVLYQLMTGQITHDEAEVMAAKILGALAQHKESKS